MARWLKNTNTLHATHVYAASRLDGPVDALVCTVGVSGKRCGGTPRVSSYVDLTQVSNSLPVFFHFLLVGWWWVAEVETPNTVTRTTKVQSPSSFTSMDSPSLQ